MSVFANSTSLVTMSTEALTATATVIPSTTATSSASTSTSSTSYMIDCQYSIKINDEDIGANATKFCCKLLEGTMSDGVCKALTITSSSWTNCVFSSSGPLDGGNHGLSVCAPHNAASSASVQRVAWGMLAVGLAAVVIAA